MKNIYKILLATILLIPSTSFGAFGVGFNATSTNTNWISPNKVNGIEQIIRADSYIATSTTATSTFAGNVQVDGSLKVNGTLYMPATVYTSFTAGSAIFAGTGGVLAQDNANFFWDDTNNRLGVGTAAPLYPLSVITDSNDNGIQIRRNNASADESAKIGFRISTSESLTNFAVIEAIRTNNPSAGDTDLTFSNQVSSVLAERMRIGVNGNVGIGLTAPAYKLEVNGTASTTQLQLPNTESSAVGGLYMEGVRAVHNFGTRNFFAGYAAGNLTMTGIGDNVGVGYTALTANTTGYRNTAVGSQALTTNTEGNANVSLGYQSMQVNTTGSNNTVVGYSALNTNTTGSNNVALGFQALLISTSTSNQTAIGFGALQNSATGVSNLAIGYHALNLNNYGNYNVGIGESALEYATSSAASYNTALGYRALRGASNNAQASYNTAIGYGALSANTTALQNTAVGYNALTSDTTGYNNTAVGASALANLTTGTDNTAFGQAAGALVTTGQMNTFLGYFGSGQGVITTGSNNILIGNDVSAGITNTASNQLNIGNLIFGTNVGSAGTLGTGNVGIGTTSPNAKLEVGGTAKIGTNTTTWIGLNETAAGAAAGGRISVGSSGVTDNFVLNAKGAGTVFVNYDNGTGGFAVANGSASLNAYLPGDGSSSAYINALGGNVGIGTSTPTSKLQVDSTTGTAQVTVSGRTTGGCIMLRDTDDNGWTEVDSLDGVLTASIDLDGLCD